jgi:5-methylcytosine-specific restriction endonuclease McrA
VDCGEKDPIVLEFDHIHSKKANVAAMLNHHGWPAIQQEIEKCEIRCANCHRRRTAKQFGWFKVRSSLQKSNL